MSERRKSKFPPLDVRYYRLTTAIKSTTHTHNLFTSYKTIDLHISLGPLVRVVGYETSDVGKRFERCTTIVASARSTEIFHVGRSEMEIDSVQFVNENIVGAIPNGVGGRLPVLPPRDVRGRRTGPGTIRKTRLARHRTDDHGCGGPSGRKIVRSTGATGGGGGKRPQKIRKPRGFIPSEPKPVG